MCRNKAYLSGDRVVLRGVAEPPHRRGEAELWRRLPDTGEWRWLRDVDIDEHGVMHWRWRTDTSDIDPDHSYGFQFRIPGHGRSNKVRLWVVARG